MADHCRNFRADSGSIYHRRCGNKGASADAGDRTVIHYAASYVTAQVRDSYLELVKTYNDEQGKEDGVYVQMTENQMIFLQEGISMVQFPI